MHLNNKEVLCISSFYEYSNIYNNIKDDVEYDIHIYQWIVIENNYLRICKIDGILPETIYTISDVRDLVLPGVYKLQLRKEDTPLTIKYRTLFPKLFKYHIELVVPNRTGIYYHIGNKFNQSDGCELVGNKIIKYKHKFDNDKTYVLEQVLNSRVTYKQMYTNLLPFLNNDNINIYIHIL
jgi:hypothetical protein